MKKPLTKAGFSLIEIILALALFAIISTATFNGMKSLREQSRIETAEASDDVRELLKQEWLLCAGGEPQGTSAIQDCGDRVSSLRLEAHTHNAPGKTKELRARIVFEKPKDRATINAKLLGNDLKERIREHIKLPEPIVHYGGEVDLGEFPLKRLLSLPDVPLGTYCRYTLDGTVPTGHSPVWMYGTLALADWSPNMAFRLFNEDPSYEPSNVVYLSMRLKSKLEPTRENGDSSYSVSYSEITQNRNRIIFSGATPNPHAKIYYQVGNQPKIPYEGPFHAPLHLWSRDGVDLKIWTEFKNDHHSAPSISEKKVHLTIQKEKLPPPNILGPEDGILKKGSKVRIQVDEGISKPCTKIVGLEGDWTEMDHEYFF